MAKEEKNSQAAAAVKSAEALANNFLSPSEEPPAETVLGDTEMPAAAANNRSARWSRAADLAAFLSKNIKGLAVQANEIAPLLLENGYRNKDMLLAASREDLAESGIKPGPRGLIMKWVRENQARAAAASNRSAPWSRAELAAFLSNISEAVPLLLKNGYGNVMKLFQGEQAHLLPKMVPKEELERIDETSEAKGTKRNLIELGSTEEDQYGRGKRRRVWKARYKPVTVQPPTSKQWYQGTKDAELFIRQCTMDCFDIMWKAVEKEQLSWKIENRKDGRHVVFIITGPPGLGKSWSSNTIVWHLVQRRQNLWFHSASEGKLTTFEFRKGVTEPTISERPEKDVKKYKPPAGTWFLYDAVGGSNRTQGMLPFQKQPPGVFCVIFSSPKESNYKTGIREMVDGLVWRLWMPSWEWPELEAVMKCLHKEHGGCNSTQEEFEGFIRSLYELWGGVPRRLIQYCSTFRDEGEAAALERSKADFQEQMRSLSKDIIDYGPTITHDMLDQVGQRGESESLSTKVPPPSWLVFPFPVDHDKQPYRNKTYKFCSQQAEVEFLKILEKRETSAVRKFCMEVFRVPAATRIAFERFAHFVLTRTAQNKFRWKQYDAKGDCETLQLPKCEDQKCDMKTDLAGFQECISQCIRESRSMVIDPQSDQQDAIDMFVVVKVGDHWMVLAMQDTISKTHSFHPVKILEYRAAARAAFQTVNVSASDDFFRHVVVVPTEDPEKPFRLQGPTMAKLDNVSTVKAKFEAFDLPNSEDMENWNSEKATEACQSLRLKNYSKLKGDELLRAGAEAFLLERAAAKVQELTWVLDGFVDP